MGKITIKLSIVLAAAYWVGPNDRTVGLRGQTCQSELLVLLSPRVPYQSKSMEMIWNCLGHI